jgi:glycosyltransferase involved in cell wall biosynthesis
VLYSLRAEGCPRLALGLLEQEILQTGRRGAVAVASEESADLRPAFEALGIPMVSLEWRPRDFAGLAWRARKALTALRPRGVICYTVGLHVPIALAARTLGVPIVLHLGNAPPASDRRARFKIQLQMLVGRPFVGSYAACSEHVRREAVRAYRLPARLVVTVPNGISVEEFLGRRGARGAGSNGGPLRVGMVGSLEVHKAQDTLIDAVALLARRGVDVRLRLIGAGSREASLRRRAQQLRVADRVEWAGVVANVAAELEKLDVFTYSVREEEGLGIALVEALAAGCPAVASDVGACREVLDGGRLGLLVPGQGADAWADAIVAARSLPPPPPDALSRYDIRQTAWAYDGLLGRGQ